MPSSSKNKHEQSAGRAKHSDLQNGQDVAEKSPRRHYYGPMIDAIENLYGHLTDDELITDLSTEPSLRRHAEKFIDPIATNKAYHQAMLYFLRKRRPGILEELSQEAAQLAAAWPANWSKLESATMTGGWWSTSLIKQFRENLREIHRGKSAKDWLDLIWPAALEILKNHEEVRVASEMEKIIARELKLPSAIYKDWKTVQPPPRSRGPARRVPVGENLWLKIRQMLRHRLIDHFDLPSRATRVKA